MRCNELPHRIGCCDLRNKLTRAAGPFSYRASPNQDCPTNWWPRNPPVILNSCLKQHASLLPESIRDQETPSSQPPTTPGHAPGSNNGEGQSDPGLRGVLYDDDDDLDDVDDFLNDDDDDLDEASDINMSRKINQAGQVTNSMIKKGFDTGATWLDRTWKSFREHMTPGPHPLGKGPQRAPIFSIPR